MAEQMTVDELVKVALQLPPEATVKILLGDGIDEYKHTVLADAAQILDGALVLIPKMQTSPCS